jgi:hypothetical protein
MAKVWGSRALPSSCPNSVNVSAGDAEVGQAAAVIRVTCMKWGPGTRAREYRLLVVVHAWRQQRRPAHQVLRQAGHVGPLPMSYTEYLQMRRAVASAVCGRWGAQLIGPHATGAAEVSV